MNDVSFSASEIALITAMLGTMTLPLAIIVPWLRSSYLDRLADIREALLESRRRNDDLRPAIERLTEASRAQTALIERMIDRREGREGSR